MTLAPSPIPVTRIQQFGTLRRPGLAGVTVGLSGFRAHVAAHSASVRTSDP